MVTDHYERVCPGLVDRVICASLRRMVQLADKDEPRFGFDQSLRKLQGLVAGEL